MSNTTLAVRVRRAHLAGETRCTHRRPVHRLLTHCWDLSALGDGAGAQTVSLILQTRALRLSRMGRLASRPPAGNDSGGPPARVLDYSAVWFN